MRRLSPTGRGMGNKMIVLSEIRKSDQQMKRAENPFKRPAHITEKAWHASLAYWEEAESNIDDEELPKLGELWCTLYFYALGIDHGASL